MWVVIVRKPDKSLHVHELGDDPGPSDVRAVITEHGIPGNWLDVNAGWDVQVSQGEPHPRLLWSEADIAAAQARLKDRGPLTMEALRAALEPVPPSRAQVRRKPR